MSDDETTVRWRDTNTAIELDDLGASNNSVQQNREEEANEYPGPFGLACKILLACTLLAAFAPIFLYALYPEIIGSAERQFHPEVPVPSRGWAAFIGGWLSLAFPPALLVAFIVYYLPTFSFSTDPSPSNDVRSERIPSKLCGSFNLWRTKSPPVMLESMAKFWWIGIGLTVGAVMLEYAFYMLYGAIVSMDLVPEALGNSTGPPTTPDAGKVSTPVAIGHIFYMSFVVAALIEETTKFCLATIMGCHLPKISHPHTVAVLLVIGTLGFATAENYFYVFASTRQTQLSTVVVTVFSRFFISVPFHASTALWISSSISSAVIDNAITFKSYMHAIWLPVICHGFFDFFLLLGDFFSTHAEPSSPLVTVAGPILIILPMIIFVILAVFAFRRMLALIREFSPSDDIVV